MSKKFVLATALFATVLLTLSAGSMSAQVKIHKLGRPWEVDNTAVPYYNDSSPTDNSVIRDQFRWNSVDSYRPGVERQPSRYSPVEVRSSGFFSPSRRSYIRELFPFFYFLHL